jgi:hypothetical protein
MVSASCYLKDRGKAQKMFGKLSAPSRALVKNICRRNGIQRVDTR